ncbi:GntR family transcriptional regulator [Glaciecola punicea ACAM 611]|jgi:GntR family transcriptional regulator|uniref:GntR family transcriptional regulator n=1 Tax=Glaciecola punicea ACAM 611 TaxID=1121923 RepID=H5TAJ2_9ALTE|nr:GntR family transcriptional regulator [Glaciecola punicea]OFA29686.1 GntR family transcriptional regulator [Glaciecola punicea]GAB55319.1 GntR family transcriptional regulator [Glaciecola punicea ACAM 611]
MITIDLDSPEPLFNQLMTQIKLAVQQKNLLPGDALPSIRQLATDLDINAKTVAKAYRLLERDCVIESKGYRGSFVHSEALNNLDADIKKWLNEVIAQDVSRYREAGATDSEIRIVFQDVLSGNKQSIVSNDTKQTEE